MESEWMWGYKTASNFCCFWDVVGSVKADVFYDCILSPVGCENKSRNNVKNHNAMPPQATAATMSIMFNQPLSCSLIKK